MEPKKHPLGIKLFSNSLIEQSKFFNTKFEHEIKANIDNFQAGIPLEDYFRNSLRNILPEMFEVTKGYIIDKCEMTCGELDIIIYNKNLAPLIKPPSTPDSIRKYIPYESVYCIIEVKQTLELGILDKDSNLKDKPTGSLWDIFSKISTFKKLNRQSNEYYSKNKNFSVESDKPLNYPLAFAFCYQIKESDSDKLLNEFSHSFKSIGKKLSPDGICINNFGFIGPGIHQEKFTFSFSAESNSVSFLKLNEFSFGYFFRKLWNYLSNTVLLPPNLIDDYGGKTDLNDEKPKMILIDDLKSVFNEQLPTTPH